MQLYFTPLSCSLATRIALYEGGGDHEFIQVGKSGLLPDGTDYRTLNPLLQVPTLHDGTLLLTENAAILQYVARKFGQLAPRDELGVTRLQQWLCFIGTELHKTVFNPLLDKAAPDEVKRYAVSKSEARLKLVSTHLRERTFLLDEFSVADAYLTAVLGWAPATPLKLDDVLTGYLKRVRTRPAVQRAFAEERELYLREAKQ
ncbi:MAG TPA: glutathione binding-like protein [Polyangiales bacterium]|nr:glutathione binding-like protein [Polyangiales bacterium]